MKHDFRTRTLAPLKTVPKDLPCNCIECQKSAMFNTQRRNRMKGYGNNADNSAVKFVETGHNQTADHADNMYGESDKSPSYYLDTVITALKPVKIWTLPGASKGGVVKKAISANQVVGTVSDFVKDKNGVDYWFILKEGGYTPFLDGYFDKVAVSDQVAIQEAAKKTKIDQAAQVRMQNNTSALYQAGKKLENAIPNFDDLFGELKWVLFGILAIVMLAVFLRIKG